MDPSASPRKMAQLNLITGCFLIVLGLVTIFWLIPFKIEAGDVASWGLSPRFFPYISAFFLVLLALIMVISNLLKLHHKQKLIREESEENEILGFEHRESFNLLYMGIGVALYMALMKYTGFLPSSILLLGVSMYFAGIRNFLLPVVAVLFPVLVKQILWITLEVYLP